MPTVPTIEPSVIQEPMRGGQLPNVPSGAFNVPGKTTDAALNLFQNERRRMNQIVVLDSDNQASEFQTGLATDLLSRQGKNAFGIYDEGKKQWNEFSNKILSGLADEGQRISVKARLDERWFQLNSRLQGHMANEQMKFDDETSKAFILNEQARVAQNYSNPAVVKESMDVQAATIRDKAAYMGFGKPVIDQIMSQNVSDNHKTVIEQMMIHGQGQQAKAYYESLPAGSLTTIDEERLHSKLKESYTNDLADKISMDALIKLTPKDETDSMNAFDALKAVRKKTGDVAVIKAAEGMVHEFVNDWNAKAKEIDDSRKQAVYKAAAADAPLKDILTMPEYIAMKGVDQETLKNHMATKAAKLDEQVKQEQALRWGELQSDPDLLTKTDLNTELVSGGIDRAQFHALTIVKDKQDPLKSDQAKNAIALIDKAASQRIFNPSDRTKNISEWNKSKNLLQTYIANNWDKPDYAPDEFAKKLMEPVRESWVQWAIDKVSFGQPGTEAATVEKYQGLSVEAGADLKRQKAIDVLTNARKPVTEANIKFVMDRMK